MLMLMSQPRLKIAEAEFVSRGNSTVVLPKTVVVGVDLTIRLSVSTYSFRFS